MKKIVLILLMVLPVTCFAGEWTSWGNVTQIYPYPEREIVYIKHSNVINPDSCSNTSFYALPKSNAMFSEIYSLFLTGHSAKKQINIYINGCEGNYPKIVMTISKNE